MISDRSINALHASERQALICDMLGGRTFLSIGELEKRIDASAATIRRDIEHLARVGKLARVRGGIRAPDDAPATGGPLVAAAMLKDDDRTAAAKQAIGRAAVALCMPGEAVMVGGGTTTLRMCPFMAGLGLQVLTNSLHIVSALVNQLGTKVLVPAGNVFPAHNIIMSAFGDECMPRVHAPRLFVGAASIGAQGLMEADIVVVAAQRRLIERAEEINLLVDATKFEMSSGNVVCGLEKIDRIITDGRISDKSAAMIEAAGVALVVAA